ncbi:ribonuclease H-like domain-containing protein [Tanacetum coccineum]|uniref:Ribonuclease H-like domain-containing protein n=1 Tax=Tanacetum coccineum TaxID=301880 RepID=A0ABQ5AIH1_9ASTR
MQKTILKQNYENFTASSQEGLNKTYDRFQKLISQLEIHGEVISQEDANLKLLRSLPSAWNNIALIIRNKSDLDTLSIDDLYNNLKVYKSEIKCKSSSSSNSQNVAFVSSDNSSSTNETINTAHSVSAASSKDQASIASYANDVMIDADDLEEMDLKWQMAMLTMRVKRFINKTGKKLDLNGKETVSFDRTNVECYNCHRRGHFSKECRAPRNQGNRNIDDPRRNAPVDTSTTNALVVQDGIGGYDWSFQAEEGITNFALMAYTSQGSSSSSSSSSSDFEREALNKYNLEIKGYQIGLESLEARIVVHEKNEAVYEEYIAFLKYDVQVKDISIKELKNQLKEALKEKDDLKLKLENFEESSKNLTKLINSQITAKDKTGLGFDEQVNESEVLDNVFDSLPPPNTGNYMPSRPDLSFAGLDDSVYKTKVSETITTASKTSKDSLEKPKTVRPSAPIIEEWDTDSDNDSVFRPKSDQTKPKFTKINFVKSGENVKSINKENTHRQVEYPRKSQSPREKPVLNNKGRVTGQREIRPVWNNAQRVNHQNKLTHPHPKRNFVPTAVATKSGQVPVNAAKQSSPRAAASISTARPVNTAAPKPKVNDALPTTYSYFKAHSPVRRAFNQKSAAKTNNFNEKVNTARGKPQYTLQDQGIFDSGCSRHMTGNKSFLTDYQEIDVKRIFRYLKGQPKLGLWYPRDSPFDLEAFSYSDYAGASLNRKSTTRGCQFFGKRLISWQCKKQTIVANSNTEAEYVVAANCRGQNETAAKDEIQVSAVRVTYYCRPIPLVTDETVIKEWEDRMERVATTASILEAKQDSVNASVSKLMLQSLNLLLPVLVYAARHSLTAVWHKLCC